MLIWYVVGSYSFVFADITIRFEMEIVTFIGAVVTALKI